MLESNLHRNRIYNKFRELTSKNRPALICFIVGGYPTIAHSEQIVNSLVKAGADIIEIGIPFSDPIADGPTIQKAYNIALKNGVTPQRCLAMCARLRKKFPNLPLLIMTYSNIVYKAGRAPSSPGPAYRSLPFSVVASLAVEIASLRSSRRSRSRE